MAHKTSKPKAVPTLSPKQLAEAMTLRILQRVATTGSIKLPAVPGLVDEYVKISSAVFAASGRGFYGHEQETARNAIASKLKEAFASSPRSKVALTFEAEPGRALGFGIDEDVTTIAQAYERWIGNTEGPLFGAHPDARVLDLVKSAADPSKFPVLDFGAGTGRNALGLARHGFPVDAVEITPRFAEVLTETANAEQLPVRVVAEDVFLSRANLRRDYQLIFASEVVPDFRGVADLRKLFELAAGTLLEGGKLLFNVHLCAAGYNPEKAARELSQQCYSCLFTSAEVTQALEGLPFILRNNDSVLDFEKANLPASIWPPTPWYENWVSGLDVYEIQAAKCPVELRWLVFEKCSSIEASVKPGVVLGIRDDRAKRFDPVALRKAIEQRFARRVSASGTLVLPAVPGVRSTYVSMVVSIFRALGRNVTEAQRSEFSTSLEQVLREAFERSQRSNVVVTYEAPVGAEIKYTLTADPAPLVEAYEDWHEAMGGGLFGDFPDARVLALLRELNVERDLPVLDLGAGLGRNALHLARQGFTVDAVECVPKFVAQLTASATAETLQLRVLQGDLLKPITDLQQNYGLVIASGLVGDFRTVGDLRRLFELVATVLGPSGHFAISLHLAREESLFQDLDAARQWAQQSLAMFFTRAELATALQGLPLQLLDDVSAHDYEQAHLPEEQFPVTEAYPEWATGRHLFAASAEQSPVTLRWLVFRRAGL